MGNRGEVKRHSEQEPNSNASFTFFGFNHNILNLESNTRFRTVMQNKLAQTDGQIILFTETAFNTPQEAGSEQRTYQNRGELVLAELALYSLLGRYPSNEEVGDYNNLLSQASVDEKIMHLGFPRDDILNYHTWRDIRLFREQREKEEGKGSFTVVFESHDPSLVTTLTKLRKESEQLRLATKTYQSEGNFEGAISMAKNLWGKYSRLGQMRDPDLAVQWGRLLKQLAKSPQGGTLIAPFGAEHFSAAQAAIRNLPKGVEAEILLEPGDLVSDVTAQIRKRGKPEDVSDTLITQMMFYEELKAGFGDVLNNRGLIDVYAYNYETICGILDQIVRTFSLDEIAQVYAVKQHCLEAISAHPNFYKLESFLKPQ